MVRTQLNSLNFILVILKMSMAPSLMMQVMRTINGDLARDCKTSHQSVQVNDLFSADYFEKAIVRFTTFNFKKLSSVSPTKV